MNKIATLVNAVLSIKTQLIPNQTLHTALDTLLTFTIIQRLVFDQTWILDDVVLAA